MAATKREQLEALVRDMEGMANAIDARGGRCNAEENQKLRQMMADSRRLSAELKAEAGRDFGGLTGKQLLAAMAAPGDSSNDSKAFLGNLASPADGGGWSPSDVYAAKASGPWATEMKNFLDRAGSKTITPSGTISVPSISSTIVQATDRPRNILSLIPFQRLENTNQFAYIKETVRTHAASTVEAGSLKPTGVYSVALIEDRVRTIATLSEPMDRALLMDVSILGKYLEGALKEGVMLALENQVINGAGSTTGVLDDMTGILASSPTAQTFGVDKLTTARKALTTLQAQNLDPSGFAWAMAPSEWESLELLTSATEYVMGDPGRSGSTLPIDQARMSLWGVPVVTSTVVPTGFALLGDFKGSAVIYEREGITVSWSDAVVTAGVTGFQTNQLTLRCEGRWGLAVTKPSGFVYADLVA